MTFNIPQLILLTAIVSQVNTIGAQIAQWRPETCPEVCTCTLQYSTRLQANLRTVSCVGRRLTKIPRHLPLDVQLFQLQSNDLEKVTPIQAPFKDLLLIDLSNNRIRTLGSQPVFENAFNLRVVDLSSNNLGHLRGNIFQGLFNLEELNLSSNRLASIADGAFNGLVKLTTLRLTSNKITFLHTQWWNPLSNLGELYLNRNYITILQSECLRPLRTLTTLDVSENKIFRFAVSALVGLNNLDFLNLSQNRLETVPRDAFRHVSTTVKSINLDSNPLERIETGDFFELQQLKDLTLSHLPRLRLVHNSAFQNLPALVVLELHDNPSLSLIDPGALNRLPRLSQLLIHNNNMTSLSQSIVTSVPALRQLTFYSNPIYCDCNSRWILEEIHSSGRAGVFVEYNHLACAGPDEHRFKVFANVPLDALPTECAPRLLPLVGAEVVRRFGEKATLDCHGVGIPAPTLQWILPSGHLVGGDDFSKADSSRYSISSNGASLTINHVNMNVAGLFTCAVQNSHGSAEMYTIVRSSHLLVQLFPVHVDATSITVSWNGTDVTKDVFQVLYREHRPGAPRRRKHHYAGTVTPAVSSYTIPNLRPGAQYEICLAVEDPELVVEHISCIKLATRPERGDGGAYFKDYEQTSNIAVGVALGVMCCVMIVLCLALVVAKRVQPWIRGGSSRDYYYNNISEFEPAFSSNPCLNSAHSAARTLPLKPKPCLQQQALTQPPPRLLSSKLFPRTVQNAYVPLVNHEEDTESLS